MTCFCSCKALASFCNQTSPHLPAEPSVGQTDVRRATHSPDTHVTWMHRAVPTTSLQHPCKPSGPAPCKDGAKPLALRNELEGNRRAWQAGEGLDFTIWIIHLKLRKQLGERKEEGRKSNENNNKKEKEHKSPNKANASPLLPRREGREREWAALEGEMDSKGTQQETR